MAKLIIIGFFCASTLVAFVSAGGGYGIDGGGYGADYYAHPSYQYKYSVRDEQSRDIKDAAEVREGNTVKGHYSLVEPDGTIRTVNYVADQGGFRAKVHRTPSHHGHGHGHGHGYY